MYPRKTKLTSKTSKSKSSNHNDLNDLNEDFLAPYPNTDSASPQTALRTLQAGTPLGSIQRQQAFRSLAEQYGNRAVQRFVKPAPQEAPAQTAEPASQEAEPTPYDDVAAGKDFRQADVLETYFSKLKSEHVIKQLYYKEKKHNELVALSEEQKRRNQFNALGLGGWHLGASTQGAEPVTKTVDKNGKKKVHDQKSIEGSQYAQQGQWHFKEDPEQVIEFFNKIVKVNVPGGLWMHETAARRLEAVYAMVTDRKQAWPETSVGQSFRGNLEHEESTASFHAHKLGFALDFRADVNPMLTDGRKRRLLQAVGGGAPNMTLGTGHRRDIRKMSQEYSRLVKANHGLPLSVEQEKAFEHSNLVDSFFEGRDFSGQYDRVRGVNNKFVGSLKKDVINELLGLRDTYLNVSKQGSYPGTMKQLKGWLSDLEKQKKSKAPNIQAIATLTENIAKAEASLGEQFQAMRDRVRVLLKPWIDAVAEQKKATEAKLKIAQQNQDNRTAQTAADRAKQDEDYKQKVVEAQAKFEKAKVGNKHARLVLPKQAKAKKDSEGDKKAAQNVQDLTNERDYWVWLEDTLSVKSYSFLDFVFEKGGVKKVEITAEEAAKQPKNLIEEEVIAAKQPKKSKKGGEEAEPPPSTMKYYKKVENGVKDPSIMQLATRGFFNPDQPQADGKDKGFNKDFVKLMLMHGFAWGATWGSQDTMHFELAEEIDKLPSSLRKYTERID